MIVDDHAMVRVGVAGLLSMEPDIGLVAEADDMDQAVTAYVALRPDVTLLDVRMPGENGLDGLARIKAIDPAARIIMLSTYDLEQPMVAAYHAGACGYLLKSIEFPELIAAVRAVHAGHTCFPPALQQHIGKDARRKALTPRELETLELIRRGLSNKEIGQAMGVSENTAKFHVKAILLKLESTDRAAAVAAAFQRGLLHVD